MIDCSGRAIEYLRISLTDICNLSCIYCKPPLSEGKALTREEVKLICKAASALGIKKIRLTGGEPLLRTDLAEMISDIRAISGIEAVAITTNGILLNRSLPKLIQAGLSRVNISLDTAQKELYETITGKNELESVLNGINSALKAKLPTRINCVPLYKWYNEQTISLCDYFANKAVDLRFIELMPLGSAQQLKGVKSSEVQAVIENTYGKLNKEKHREGAGPSEYYTLPGFKGKIGFISPLSHRFCSSCNRIRLTSEGFLRTCLGHNDGVSLREIINSGEDLTKAMQRAIYEKPDGHNFDSCAVPDSMGSIGG